MYQDLRHCTTPNVGRAVIGGPGSGETMTRSPRSRDGRQPVTTRDECRGTRRVTQRRLRRFANRLMSAARLALSRWSRASLALATAFGRCGDVEKEAPRARRQPKLLPAMGEVELSAHARIDAQAFLELGTGFGEAPLLHQATRLSEQAACLRRRGWGRPRGARRRNPSHRTHETRIARRASARSAPRLAAASSHGYVFALRSSIRAHALPRGKRRLTDVNLAWREVRSVSIRRPASHQSWASPGPSGSRRRSEGHAGLQQASLSNTTEPRPSSRSGEGATCEVDVANRNRRVAKSMKSLAV
jgi:hypothetical protein